MFSDNLQDIDIDRLADRVKAEQAAAAAAPRPLKAARSAAGRRAAKADRLLRLKMWLRRLPLLGALLAALNHSRRQPGLRAKLLALPLLGALLRWGKSLARLTEMRTELHAARIRLGEVQAQAYGLERQTAELRRLNDELRAALQAQGERLVAQQESSAAMAADLADLHRLLAGLRTDIQFQQRRLSRAIDAAALPPAQQPSALAGAGSGASDALDAYYADFENRFRGSRAEIKARLGVHASRLQAAGIGSLGKPILDIGCGRGEWLELLREAGLAAYGIDLNSVAVAECASWGLDAREAEAIAHLRGLGAASLAAVSAFHVIEHLALETLIELLDEANRVLLPGGMLILETPNPENLIVGACNFYLDPTHRNPIPPAVGGFMVESRGFIDVEVVPLHAFSAEHLLPEDSETARRLNRLLYGPQDYAVIARKA